MKINSELHEYLKPELIQTQLTKKFREEKINEEELRKKIKEEYLYECPKSTQEKTSAEVFKRVAEYKLKLKQGEIANKNTGDETFKPQLSKNLERRYEKVRVHDGAWKFNEIAERETWSCCMKEEYNAVGCILKIKDKDRWITISL